MRNCKKIEPWLYFEFNKLLSESISESNLNNNLVINLFKSKIKSTLGLDGVTDIEIKSFIEASSQDLETIQKILNSGSTSDEEIEEEPEKPAREEEINEVENESDEDAPKDSNDSIFFQVGISEVMLTNSPYTGKLMSPNDLYEKYFKGTVQGYNFFRNMFSNRLFSSSFVSFERGVIIENQKQLNDSIQLMRDSLLEDLSAVINIPKDIKNDFKSLREFIDSNLQNLSISNLSLNDSIKNKKDNEYIKAYFAYIAIKHFDDLIKMLSVNIKIDKNLHGYYNGDLSKKYSVNIKHHQKNNFSDSYVNMLDEITTLTRSMIEFTPLIGIDGKEKYGQYLTTTGVNSLAAKLKDPKFKVDGALDLRLNPQLRIKELLKYIIKNSNQALNKGFNRADLDTAITVYNYFYKTDDDLNDNLLKNKLKSGIHSLVSIKSKSFSEKNKVSSNLIVNAITCQMDKTISQKYISLKETKDGLQRMYTQMEAIDKHFARTRNNLNIQSSQIYEEIEDIFTFSQKNGKYSGLVSFKVDDLKFNAINAISEDIEKDNKGYEHLTAEEWSNYLSSESLDDLKNPKKKNFAKLVKFASDFTGLGLTSANGEIILAMSEMSAEEIAENLIDIVTKMAYARLIKKKHRDSKTSDNLKDFADPFIGGDFELDKYVKGDILQPFSQKRNVSFFNTYAIAKAISKNEVSKAVSRNRNGDGLPNASLYNLIGDDKTSFSKILKLDKKDSARKNLFGINDVNFSIIEDTIYRSDIEMMDGTIKNVKKFNSSEIATQGVFSDFLLGLAHDGKVMLEPTVFADKVGQAMKLFNLQKTLEYSGINPDNKQVKFNGSIIDIFRKGDLRNLHFQTLRGQYQSIHDKLINDYRDIYEYVLNKTDVPIVLSGLENKITTNADGTRSLKNFTFSDYNTLMSQNVIRLEDYSTVTGRRIEIQQEVHYVKGNVNGLLLKNFKQYRIGEFKKVESDPKYSTSKKTYYERRMLREDKKFLRAMQEMGATMQCVNAFGKLTADFQKILDFYVKEIHDFGKDYESATTEQITKVKNDFINEWVNPDGTFKLFKGYLSEEDVYNDKVNVEINPLIDLFHQSHQVLTQNYNMAIVGGAHAHKMKSDRKKELAPFNKNNESFKFNKQSFIAKYLTEDEIWEEIEESARTIAMHKRMVAYQAKLHLFTQNLIEGVPLNMKMVVVLDVVKNVWNTIGDGTGFDVADGSGWVPMVAALKFRDSLGDMGADTVTFKAIRHDIDGDTQAAHLDKYAIQALSNERLRKSEGSSMPLSYMNQRAMSTVTFDEVFPGALNILSGKNHIKPDNSINNSITNYSEANIKNLKMPHFLGTSRIIADVPGADMYAETIGMGYNNLSNDYVIVKKFKKYDGSLGFPLEAGYTLVDKVNGIYYKTQKINTIYDLWQNALGGMYSISETDHENEFKIGDTFFKYSDASHEHLNSFLDNVAIKKDDDFVNSLRAMGIKTNDPNNSNFEDQDNYYQPLKEALIWQINNQSGMKNGAKNVNNSSYITTNPDTGSGKFNYFITTSTNYGVQGNFDHIYDEEHEARVTESTLMISLAASNGYLRHEVDKLYKALAVVVKNSMGEYNQALSNGDDMVILMLTKTLLRTLETKERLGLAQAYGLNVKRELDRLIKENPNMQSLKDAKYKLPLSDPNFYAAMVSMVSGALNSSAIRRDLSGLGAVLSQCHDSMTIVETADGKIVTPDKVLSSKIKELITIYAEDLQAGDTTNFNIALSEFKKNLRERSNELDYVIQPLENIQSFDTILANGLVYELNSGKDYYQLKNNSILPDGTSVVGDIKVLKYGQRNLKSRYFKFFVTENEVPTGIVFNEMDLLGSKIAWAFTLAQKTGFTTLEGNPNSGVFLKFLLTQNLSLENLKTMPPRQLKELKNLIIQQQQDELSLLDKKGIFTLNYDQALSGKYEVIPGEIILPMINRHKFGISEGMNISDVTIDFFRQKFSKTVEANLSESDFYLTVRNGNHVNFLSAANWDELKNTSVTKVDDKYLKVRDGKKYLLDSNNITIMEVTDNLEVFTTNSTGDPNTGTILVKYKTVNDVKDAFDSSYFVSIGYNFKSSSNKVIAEYINKYDKRSRKYLENGKIVSKSKSLYDGDKDFRLNRIANEVMFSWEEQLKITGTRIPAQALQSVMAMKIVGFTDKGLNTAYVPVKKNYLDGSDFDIDKIYMTGRSVSSNGKYNSWSPYFNYADIETSNRLPFPDRKSRKNQKTPTAINLSKDEALIMQNYANHYYLGLDHSEEALSIWPDVVDILNKLSNHTEYTIDGEVSDIFAEADEFINDYFLSDIKDQNTILEASKNAVSSGLFRISNSVVNSMASDRGVDMNDPAAGAKKSPKTWASKQFSGDNYATLPLMKEENGAGKDVIGIAAVGTKVFYALSQFYNQKMQELTDKYNLLGIDYSEQINLYTLAFDEAISKGENPPKKSDYFDTNFIEAYDEFYSLMNPREYSFYNESTKSVKTIITTFLANINFLDNPVLMFMNDISIKFLKNTINSVEVIDATKTGDTSLVLSALLSSATDNAKELILAKINAGPELAGMYVYMVIQGIDFDDITDFMVSPTVDAIVKKSKSNIFSYKKSNIKKSVEYFLEGVDIKQYFNKDQIKTINNGLRSKISKNAASIIEGELKIDEVLKQYNTTKQELDKMDDIRGSLKEIKDKLDFLIASALSIKKSGISKSNVQDLLLHIIPLEERFKFLSVMEDKPIFNNINFWGLRKYFKVVQDNKIMSVMDIAKVIIPFDGTTFNAFVPSDEEFSNNPFNEKDSYINQPMFKMLLELRQRLNIMLESDFNIEKAYEFLRIYEESDEITNFGARLGINGGMGTDLYSHYSYNQKASSYFYERLNLIMDPESEGADKALSRIINLFSENIDTKAMSFTDKLIFVTDFENFNKPDYSEDPEKINKKQQYRKEVINLYDAVKSKFNIVDAEQQLPHFQAMIGVHASAIDLFDSNTKYRYTRQLMKNLQDKGYYKRAKSGNYAKYTDVQVKLIGNFITSQFVNLFFDSTNIKYTIPAGFSYYDDNFNLVTSDLDKELNLSTMSGRVSFKLFMEQHLLPDMKKNATFAGNKFIENIIYDVSKDPVTGDTYSYMKLDLDMLNIKSDSDKIAFQEFLNGYSDLKHIKISGHLASDLFVIYNLLIHNNSFGKDNFTKLFEADVNGDLDTLINMFMNFVGEVDFSLTNSKGSQFPIDIISLDNLNMVIAPVVSYSDLNKDNGQYVKVLNYDTLSYDIYRRFVDEDGLFEYNLVEDLNKIHNTPSKLHMDNSTNQKLLGNDVTKYFKFRRFIDEYQKGNINILINCD